MGITITPKLREIRALGGNVVRCFGQVNGAPGHGWDDYPDYLHPDLSRLGAFFDVAASHGLRVEWVVLTYPDSLKSMQAALRKWPWHSRRRSGGTPARCSRPSMFCE